MSIVGSTTASVSVTQVKNGVELTSPTERINQSAVKNVSVGHMWHDKVQLYAGDVSGFTFNDGSLSDVFGQALTLSAIVGLYVTADSDNSSTVYVSGGAGSPLPTLPVLAADEGLVIQSRIAITSNGTIYLANSSGSLSGEVDFVVVGE